VRVPDWVRPGLLLAKLMGTMIVADKGPVTCVLLWYPAATNLSAPPKFWL
jgi:hypothetical protein